MTAVSPEPDQLPPPIDALDAGAPDASAEADTRGTDAVEPVQVEPVPVEPVQVEPVPVEPVQVEPVPVEPVPVRSTRSGSRGRLPAVLAVSVLAVFAGAVLFLSGWTMGRQTALTPGTPVSDAQLFQPFWDSWRAVTERYAGGDVDRRQLVEGAIKGMIAALDDPYSMYLTSDEFKATLRDISGEFEGIGTTIGTVDGEGRTAACPTLGDGCQMAIIAPIKDAPAEKAGLLPGDIIVAIDGAPVAGQTLDEARARVRGPKDTAVVLTIRRGGGAPFDVEIVRAVIISPEVDHRDLADGKVGYIRLSGFSEHAAEEIARVVAADVEAGKEALVLDLRGNPGGFVTAARSIASQFLADGTIFYEEDADGTLQETVAQPGGAATDPATKLIVLVDGGSASASEIVAGALHDRGRAQLVGTKTFGKGTVQQWTQLEEDSGGFRLTVAKWLTPAKTWVHENGIVPDVVVETAPAAPGDDPVLDKALELLGFGPSAAVLRIAA